MSKHEHRVELKRAYEEADANDGTRVLVDRLWPRGLSKERARVDAWLKEVAPSDELRRWFGHDPDKFAEFRKRYEAELASESGKEAMAKLGELVKRVAKRARWSDGRQSPRRTVRSNAWS